MTGILLENCHPRRWSKASLTIAFSLAVTALSVTSYVATDIMNYKHTFSSYHISEIASDYAFLIKSRYELAKVKARESQRLKRADRRVKEGVVLRKEDMVSQATQLIEKQAVIRQGGRIKEMAPVTPEAMVEKAVSSDDGKHHLVWLMAYPFSGSTVALRIVQDFSGASQATNYGDIVDTNAGFVSKKYTSVPIDDIHPNGPFQYRMDKPLPKFGHLLVKTHCSGYCIDDGTPACPLESYVNPLTKVHNFFATCSAGTKYNLTTDTQTLVSYNGYNMEKIVLLVRDPLEIILARFVNKYEGEPTENKSYRMSANGLKEWCDTYDGQHGSINLKSWLSPEGKKLVDSGEVTCFAELYRIAKFYNQAFKVAEYTNFPVHYIHFEDYEKDLGGTIYGLLHFLHYDVQPNLRQKVFERIDPQGQYFFNDAQVAKMSEFLKAEVSPATQKLFKDYI